MTGPFAVDRTLPWASAVRRPIARPSSTENSVSGPGLGQDKFDQVMVKKCAQRDQQSIEQPGRWVGCRPRHRAPIFAVAASTPIVSRPVASTRRNISNSRYADICVKSMLKPALRMTPRITAAIANKRMLRFPLEVASRAIGRVISHADRASQRITRNPPANPKFREGADEKVMRIANFLRRDRPAHAEIGLAIISPADAEGRMLTNELRGSGPIPPAEIHAVLRQRSMRDAMTHQGRDSQPETCEGNPINASGL